MIVRTIGPSLRACCAELSLGVDEERPFDYDRFTRVETGDDLDAIGRARSDLHLSRRERAGRALDPDELLHAASEDGAGPQQERCAPPAGEKFQGVVNVRLELKVPVRQLIANARCARVAGNERLNDRDAARQLVAGERRRADADALAERD